MIITMVLGLIISVASVIILAWNARWSMCNTEGPRLTHILGTVLHEIPVSGTVLWSPTNSNSPAYTYISQKPWYRHSSIYADNVGTQKKNRGSKNHIN